MIAQSREQGTNVYGKPRLFYPDGRGLSPSFGFNSTHTRVQSKNFKKRGQNAIGRNPETWEYKDGFPARSNGLERC